MLEKLKENLFKKQKTIIEVGYFNGSKDNLLPSIAFWNEFGTYTAPARPFFRNTINEYQKQWVKNYIKANENTSNYRIAMQIKDNLQFVIRRGQFKENSPITIYGGWMKNKKSGKLFYVKGKGEGKPPLTDTGKLADSVEIRLGGAE